MAWAEKYKGKYRGRYRDANGDIRSAGTSTSKKVARQLAEEKEAEVRHGTWTDPTAGSLTFSDYFEKHWLPNRGNELNTLAGYESHYNSSLKEAFGETPVNKISTGMVQRWVIAEGKKGGVKPGTIVAKYRTLSTCLGGRKGVSAVRDKLIAENPCVGVDLPVIERDDPDLFEPDEVDELMERVDPWWQPVLILAAETAARWGELLGLTADDVVSGGVWIRRTVTETTIARTGNGTPFKWKPWPKGRKPRFVSVAPEVEAMLRTLIKERRLFPKDRLFSMPDQDGLPRRSEAWPEGVPIGRSYFRESIWMKALAGAKLKHRKFHNLRGSHITWLITGGADLVTVMDRAGHRQLSTTQVYVARMPDAEQQALDALAIAKERLRGRKKAAEAQASGDA